jgi:2-polyprenyl-6-methoxyphenol hydroxylase-like FAD-dependent oxidoreductase
MAPPNVVIAGAGPAGMVLAYQLASHGVPVHVIERHPDFRREFRGELVHTSALAPLEKIGVLSQLKARGLATDNVERRMFVGPKRRVHVPGSNVRGNVISQPGFLELLHELCSAYPHYRLDFSTTAVDVARDGDRVTGVNVRRGGEESTIGGDLVVVCSGRNSVLRKAAGLVPESFHIGENTMWLRFDFSEAPQLLPSTVDIYMWGNGVVVVLFRTIGDRLQVAVQAPGDVNALRKDIPALKDLLLPKLPAGLREKVDAKLDSETESQMFKVAVDRLLVWHAPGILFLGDAAHTMSPSGAVGLNLAMIDAFCAADAFLAAIDEGRAIDGSVFQSIQDARLPPIVAAQEAQLRAHGMVNKPLPLLHVMFTILQLFLPMIEKKVAAAETRLAPFEIRYARAPA